LRLSCWNGAFAIKTERNRTQESPSKAPAYLVTFSDMTTLLLTFFVMLMSLAGVQDPALFYVGRGSFVESVRGLGLGMLQGRRLRPDFGNDKLRYSVDNPEKSSDVRTIDAKEEEVRRIFEEVSRSMTTMPSRIVAERTDFSVTNIGFSSGDASLDEVAQKFLTQFCSDLQQDHRSKGGTLYVLGLASDQLTQRQQWILSARRAQAVADSLQRILSSRSGFQTARDRFDLPPDWRVHWWGAGPGGDWVRPDSPISERSQILIAVLRASD